MKIIHCADLHLDSRMTTHLNRDKARERRGELLTTFERMIHYAVREEVQAILIAGDLFDTRSVSAAARSTVLHAVEEHPEILFFYLRGNHDDDSFLSELPKLPDNLKLFSRRWTSYRLGNIVIHGLELSEDNIHSMARTLPAASDDINIVLLHGQDTMSAAGERGDLIDLRSLRGRNIDYLALGHIHSYRMDTLDGRGIYCYPGCLEGRGFDECGPHGFVLLEIDEQTGHIDPAFVPLACRLLHEIPVDVTSCMNTREMIALASRAAEAAGASPRDLVKFVLTGTPHVECEKDPSRLASALADRFYYVSVADETKLRIDPAEYIMDESLKGEFVRTILADHDLNEKDRMTILRYGLLALAGEEVC